MTYPMFMMVLLTFVVGGIAVSKRFASVKNGVVKASYYKLMQGQEAPESVIKSTRCFNNLFELPVLFYVVCTLYIALGIHSTVALFLAWLFVVFRYAQTYIHLSYNHILHRMCAFWGGFLVIMALWLNLLLRY